MSFLEPGNLSWASIGYDDRKLGLNLLVKKKKMERNEKLRKKCDGPASDARLVYADYA